MRGTDPETDLAVLKADASDLPAITFGDLSRVQVGDVVLAIGNPFGFGSTVTLGIVSALGRTQLGINRYEDFIQTDAAINPGNSGGALVDAAGRLIGINSTIYSRSGGSQGIGFAIPVTLARDVLAQIIEKGEVTRGWLGVEPQDVDEGAAKALALDRVEGVIIRSVQRGGPADRAGIKVLDVVVDVEGRATREHADAARPHRAAGAGLHREGHGAARGPAGHPRRRRRPATQAEAGVTDGAGAAWP